MNLLFKNLLVLLTFASIASLGFAEDKQFLNINVNPANATILKGSENNVYFVVDVTAQEVKLEKRLPMNLSLVIDRSGSMDSAGKLDYVKQAAKFLIKNLQNSDIVSIVIYDDQVDVLQAATPVTDQKKLLQLIDNIYAGGSTYIEGGLRKGIEEVKKNNSVDKINRVLMLSDGLANVGLSDSRSLGKVAQEASQKGISVTSMGVGTDFDEALMMALAEYGSGNYHFIGKPGDVSTIFQKELKELKAIVATNTELDFKFPSSLVLHQIYGYQNYEQLNGTIKLPLGDFFSGDNRRVVIHFKAISPDADSYDFDIHVNYKPAEDKAANLVVKTKIKLTGVDDQLVFSNNENKEVILEIEYVENAKVFDEAMKLYSQGNYDEAKALLDNRIKETKPTADASGNEKLKKQVEKLEEQRAEMDVYDDYAPSSEAVQGYSRQNRAENNMDMKKR